MPPEITAEQMAVYRAVSRLLDLDPAISVDLVQAEFASPAWLEMIEAEGVFL